MYYIYKVTNLINNKIYIGQTTLTIEKRKDGHFREARCKKRINAYFHNAINKYGEDNFEFIEIDTAETIEELNEKEIYWIEYYNSNNKNIGYNLDSGGKNTFKSDSTKSKIGANKKLNWEDEELSNRMKLGLFKATKKWQEISFEKQITLICDNCNKEFKKPKHLAKNRKFCSSKCFQEYNHINNLYDIGLAKANELNKTNYIKKSNDIKSYVIDWVKNNKNVVIYCPYNRISTNLKELFDLLYNEYSIKDIRSISNMCCDSNSRKDFLNWLKSYC